MKKSAILYMVAMFVLLAMSKTSVNAQDCDPVTRTQMRSMLVQLGYEVKDLETEPGKEKYSIKTTSHNLNIYVAVEQSANSKYIWLTANLGDAPPDTSIRYRKLIRENAIIQPSLFYTSTSGLLMMGLPLENKGLTNVFLRDRIETISNNVGKTRHLWDWQE